MSICAVLDFLTLTLRRLLCWVQGLHLSCSVEFADSTFTWLWLTLDLAMMAARKEATLCWFYVVAQVRETGAELWHLAFPYVNTTESLHPCILEPTTSTSCCKMAPQYMLEAWIRHKPVPKICEHLRLIVSGLL